MVQSGKEVGVGVRVLVGGTGVLVGVEVGAFVGVDVAVGGTGVGVAIGVGVDVGTGVGVGWTAVVVRFTLPNPVIVMTLDHW